MFILCLQKNNQFTFEKPQTLRTNHTSDEELMSRIYKKLFQLNNKTTAQLKTDNISVQTLH